MRFSTFCRAGLAIQSCFLIATAVAHDAWTEPTGSGYIVRYGHGDKHEGYAPAKVKAVAAFDAGGAALPVTLTPDTEAVRFGVSGQAALVTLQFDNGIWTKTRDGSKNLPKDEVPGALSAAHSLKFGKTVLAWSPSIIKPQGQQLEILPMSTAAPTPGGTLEVQVLWEGKPLGGAKVASSGYGKEKAIETDAAGKAAVPITAGRQMLTVGHSQNIAGNPHVDSLTAAANLIFEAR